ncbi:MAG: hypothetical protein V4857_18045 [Pseudomonadota bacterium]
MTAPIYLYLRPFTVDGVIEVDNPEKNSLWRNLMPTSSNATRPYVNLEELILQALAARGTLLAIGRTTNIVGAGKIIAGEDKWRDYFDMLSARAACIISVPSLHPSTLWELEQLAQRALFSRVLMIFTGLHFAGKDVRYLLPNLAPKLKQAGWDLPADLTATSLVTFAQKGDVSCHHADSRHRKRHLAGMIDKVLERPVTSSHGKP